MNGLLTLNLSTLHGTVPHTWFFRTVYIRPQQGFVLSGVNVAIKDSFAVATGKCFTLPFAYVKTLMAGLTCICGWHLNQLHTTEQTFIAKKHPELVKVPFANPASEFFAFLVGR